MKTKLFPTLLLLTFLLTACGAGTPAPVTRIPTATQPPTDITRFSIGIIRNIMPSVKTTQTRLKSFELDELVK